MHELNHITGAMIGASYRISMRLGPGLVESVYQKWISFDFEGMWFDNAFKVDPLVERAVLVEVKSQKEIAARDKKQLLTYLRLLDLRLGLLINFGAATLKDGIKRIAN